MRKITMHVKKGKTAKIKRLGVQKAKIRKWAWRESEPVRFEAKIKRLSSSFVLLYPIVNLKSHRNPYLDLDLELKFGEKKEKKKKSYLFAFDRVVSLPRSSAMRPVCLLWFRLFKFDAAVMSCSGLCPCVCETFLFACGRSLLLVGRGLCVCCCSLRAFVMPCRLFSFGIEWWFGWIGECWVFSVCVFCAILCCFFFSGCESVENWPYLCAILSFFCVFFRTSSLSFL